MPEISASVACNLDADILSACLPLFQESRVEAMEWSFDTLFGVKEVPGWFVQLLNAFSSEKKLIGHGVFFSLFSGRWSPHQEKWLQHLRQVCKDFSFDHITEHFGFMTGKDFHHGAPLNIPYTETTLNIGRDRLQRIYEACKCPVGLENLAFSYTLDEVKKHGEFLEKLIQPVNGFIILDLHNLYCQVHNFSVTYDEIITLYPLEKVREIHISGGSWETAESDPSKNIRRDTHDGSVPGEVYDFLNTTIDKCPNLKYVVLEQLGNGLKTEQSRKSFYDDFLRMEEIVHKKNRKRPKAISDRFLPLHPLSSRPVIEDSRLYEQQLELSSILETAATYKEVVSLLEQSSLAHSDWEIEKWEPHMLETAVKIAQKWKKK